MKKLKIYLDIDMKDLLKEFDKLIDSLDNNPINVIRKHIKILNLMCNYIINEDVDTKNLDRFKTRLYSIAELLNNSNIINRYFNTQENQDKLFINDYTEYIDNITKIKSNINSIIDKIINDAKKIKTYDNKVFTDKVNDYFINKICKEYNITKDELKRILNN